MLIIRELLLELVRLGSEEERWHDASHGRLQKWNWNSCK